MKSIDANEFQARLITRQDEMLEATRFATRVAEVQEDNTPGRRVHDPMRTSSMNPVKSTPPPPTPTSVTVWAPVLAMLNGAVW